MVLMLAISLKDKLLDDDGNDIDLVLGDLSLTLLLDCVRVATVFFPLGDEVLRKVGLELFALEDLLFQLCEVVQLQMNVRH